MDLIIHDINLKYKEQIVVKGTSRLKNEKIPFTSLRADYLCYGGVPRGKATEFFGTEGSGKTTSALDIVKNAQILAIKEYEDKLKELKERILKLGDVKSYKKEVEKLKAEIEELTNQGIKKVVYVDSENTLDEEWARSLGVNTDELELMRPLNQTAEQVLQMMLDMLNSGGVILMVLDSIPMLIPQQLYEESMEKKSYCGVAGPMAIFSAKVSPIISKTNTALIMINQVREDINNPYNMYNTPGGKALKHLYALRILFNKGAPIDEENVEQKCNFEFPVGHLVQMQIAKTKVSKPDRKLGFYTLKYDAGIDYISDMVSMAILYNYIIRASAWFSLMEDDGETIITDEKDNPLKFQGRVKLLDYIRNHKVILDELNEKVMSKLKD